MGDLVRGFDVQVFVVEFILMYGCCRLCSAFLMNETNIYQKKIAMTLSINFYKDNSLQSRTTLRLTSILKRTYKL